MWDDYGRRSEPDDWYDVMQVCLNGHQITAFAVSQPQSRRQHCQSCGASTVMTCPHCGQNIRGHRHIAGVIGVFSSPVSNYCDHCGGAYAWQTARMDNVRQVLKGAGIADADVERVEALLPDIARETPATGSASLGLRGIINTISDTVAKEVVHRALRRVACSEAVEILGLTKEAKSPRKR